MTIGVFSVKDLPVMTKSPTLITALFFVASTLCHATPESTALLADSATVFNTSEDAFAKPIPTLPTDKLRDFTFGNRLFNTNWVTAPSSLPLFDGLGPTFNRVSCSGCHFKDGRGRPPLTQGGDMTSMLIRLSVPGKAADGGPKPHPNYGGQLNSKAILGVPAEGKAVIEYKEIHGHYPDGSEYHLREPHYRFENLAFGPLGDDILFSPRVAPAVHGLGLLEAIPEKTLLGFADPDDKDQDGISGRANRVWNAVENKKSIGRFGWKANQPSLMQQDAGAALGDIGLTTHLNPNENCPNAQDKCRAAPHGGSPELGKEHLDKLVFYTQTLAVPARRDIDNNKAKYGESLFSQIGCDACHKSHIQTGEHSIPQLSHLTIHPYTDLLLHDMGDALSDKRPDYEANGNEWRTPPLWGIGLVERVNKHTFFMHDGRARNLEEAILWHGGEGEASKQAFMSLDKDERQAVILFLESL